MGRGAEGGGGGETGSAAQQSGIDRVLPRAPGPLQVSAIDRILRNIAQDCDRQSAEKRVAQEIPTRTCNHARVIECTSRRGLENRRVYGLPYEQQRENQQGQ